MSKSQMITIQFRVDRKIKTEAQKVFKRLGMTMSSALRLSLIQVIRTESIPFVATSKEDSNL
mgnify:CR=1 FL=1